MPLAHLNTEENTKSTYRRSRLRRLEGGFTRVVDKYLITHKSPTHTEVFYFVVKRGASPEEVEEVYQKVLKNLRGEKSASYSQLR